MANICNFGLLGMLDDVVDNGAVVFGHVLPGKVEEFLGVLFGIIFSITKTVCVATGIAEPDVIAGSGGNEGGSHARVVHDPTVCGVEDAMLQQDWGPTGR